MRNRVLAIAAIVLIWLGSLGPAQILAQSVSPNASSPLGTNTDFFRSWSSEWVFVDAFKQSRGWLPQCIANQQPDCTYANQFDTGEAAALDLDANGWVRSLPRPQDPPIYWAVGALMFQNLAGHYPAGQYVVLYEGQGTITYAGDARRNAALSSPGRDVLDVTPANAGIIVQITATDPNRTGDYLRNIRVIMPGFEATYATQVFHPTFLERVARFKVLRFKDWLETDASTQSSWATRTLPTTARWNTPGGAGIPIEILMALANRTQADAWVNMPHMATDDYMRQFATLVRDTLGPNQRVYVEYSNEIWNGAPGFTQSGWVQQQAVARWTGSDSAFTKQINWHGMRTAQTCDIWKQAWGAQSSRVVCVLGAQASTPWTASQALDCPLWVEGRPCRAHGIDAVAIGPYFGGYLGSGSIRTQVQTWTSDPDGGLGRLFQELNQGGVVSGGPAGGGLAQARQFVAGHVTAASQRGLYVVAYEGGTHLYDAGTPSDPALGDLFNRANHDPRMGAVYDRYLADWRAAAGTTNATRVFVHFKNVGQPGRFGSFGALDYVDQTSSPRYDALLRFVDANACWWPNCAASAPPTCTPRPNVAVSVVPAGPGRLQATLTAQTNASTPTNALQSVQLTSAPGAVAQDLSGNPLAVPSTPSLASSATSYSFYVRQATAGAPATVNVTVVDACGSWSTFVGGGPSAFPGSAPGSPMPATATPMPGASSPTGPAANPAATATLTATPTAPSCTPRPTLQVTTAPASAGQLRITVSAPAGSNDDLRALRFGAATNALITASGQSGAADFAVTLPTGTRQTSFTVTRVTAGQAVNVPFTVTDACGDWSTFVGGGPGAF